MNEKPYGPLDSTFIRALFVPFVGALLMCGFAGGYFIAQTLDLFAGVVLILFLVILIIFIYRSLEAEP